MRVLIYSPVRLFADGISAFLSAIDRVEAVCVESDPAELEQRAAGFLADVILFDVTVASALPVARNTRALFPDVAMIAMAVPEVADDVIACADAGFAAYIPRDASAAEMVATVDLAVRGETVCHPRITRVLFDELSRRHPSPTPHGPDEPLTPREAETARMIARGLSNKEIARELHLSIATVKNHVHAVLRKLRLGSRSQVATLLVANPWIVRAAQPRVPGRMVDV